MKPVLRLPVDFELRDDLRTLVRLLAAVPTAPVCAYLFRHSSPARAHSSQRRKR